MNGRGLAGRQVHQGEDSNVIDEFVNLDASIDSINFLDPKSFENREKKMIQLSHNGPVCSCSE